MVLIIYTEDSQSKQEADKNMICFFLVKSLHLWLLTAVLRAATNSVPITYSFAAPTTMISTQITTKPGCPRQCGNLTIPYPFGMNNSVAGSTSCSRDSMYEVFCSSSYDPPKAFLSSVRDPSKMVEIIDISETQLRVRNEATIWCVDYIYTSIHGRDQFIYPFPVSPTANKLLVIGCALEGSIQGPDGAVIASTQCSTSCSSTAGLQPDCGNADTCCRSPLPKGLSNFTISVQSTATLPIFYRQCNYAFIGDETKLRVNVTPNFTDAAAYLNKINFYHLPVILDWAIVGETCSQAKQNSSTYACEQNTSCSEADSGGYHCRCLAGYQGNPYLPPGCTDFNECEDPKTSPCSGVCRNSPGSYSCSCPSGYHGDGKKNGIGCIRKKPPFPILKVSLGTGFGILGFLIIITWACLILEKRKSRKTKEKFFHQNGGLMFKQLLSSTDPGSIQTAELFSIDELRTSTKNFSTDRILGKGGSGIVYKGILSKNRVVAIKKSKIGDTDQIEEFINEVAILTRINHRNVVKLLGCCLENEVPLLVYEFISNGTLYSHIHSKSAVSWLTWRNCLRVATEVANAVAYLHFAASIPIIHRDIKSANILLDENHTAKVSDFGGSRLIPLDQKELSTNILGTYGYLDPEYYQSGHLTEKSDVYSFGVVLAELLTREKPVSSERKEFALLATYFVDSVKDGRLLDILEPQLVADASQEELISISELVVKCLGRNGKDRPTMREVAAELEGFCKLNKYQTQYQGVQGTETVSLLNKNSQRSLSNP
ncbi:hypothetical protein Droror1_Dr00025796 [Drosera rotundifolia]